MRSVVVPALVVTVLTVTGLAQQQSRQQQSPYYTPEQLEQIGKMPAVDESKRVAVDDIDQLLADGNVVFLDVREPKEIEDLGTRPGYINIPILELEQRLSELPKDKAILTA